MNSILIGIVLGLGLALVLVDFRKSLNRAISLEVAAQLAAKEQTE